MPSISKARFDALIAIEHIHLAEGAELVARVQHENMRVEQLKVDLACAVADLSACNAQLKSTLEAPSAPSEVEVVDDKRTLMAVAKKLSMGGLRVSLRGTALFDVASGKLIAQVRA